MADPHQTLLLASQVMMGVSLAACAGLRAWMPLFALGTLGRLGFVALNPSFHVLQSTPALVIFAVATVLELLGDKFIAVDHALDAVGTLVRPLAGAALTAASLQNADPTVALVAGLVVGGGTALTVHAGKAVVRAKSTSTAIFHGGAGNAALSLIEDGATVAGIALAVLLPFLAFLLALALLGSAVVAVYLFWRAGRRLWRLFFGSPARA